MENELLADKPQLRNVVDALIDLLDDPDLRGDRKVFQGLTRRLVKSMGDVSQAPPSRDPATSGPGAPTLNGSPGAG
jgi:hypothetical protein